MSTDLTHKSACTDQLCLETDFNFFKMWRVRHVNQLLQLMESVKVWSDRKVGCFVFENAMSVYLECIILSSHVD